MGPGLGAVSFSVLPMALGALLHVNVLRSAEIGPRGRERVLQFLEFLGNDPRLVLLPDGVNERQANQGKQRSEEDFACPEIEQYFGGHSGKKNFRTFNVATKG